MKPKFSVKLKRGDSVVHSTITEVPFTTVTQPPTSNMVGERVTVVNENVPTTQVRVESGAGRTIEQPVEPQVKATEPPAQANPYKISSAGIGQSHSYNNRPNHYGFGSGSNTAVRTKTVNSNNQQFKRPARPPIREDVMPKVTEFLDHIFKSFGRGTVIDLARRLGVFWIDPKDREEGFKVLPQRNYNQNQEGANNHVKAKEPVSKPENTTGNATQQQKAEPHAESGEVKAAGKDEGASEGKEKKVILPEVEPEKKVVQPEYKAQTEGLFPVKPMSREELDALDMQNREDNVAMGFPGEPLANTMRMSQYFPQLKKRVEDHLNGFSFDDIEDEGKVIDRLHKAISDLTADEIARISGTDTSGIEIMINATLDHMNRTCYAVTIENRKSPVFETIIYPEHKDDEGKVNVEARKIADGINLLENQNPVEVKQEETVEREVVSSNEEAEAGVGSEEFNDFLKEKVAEYRDEMLQQGEVADQQGFMIQALISELKNAGLQFGVSNRIAKRYVTENYPFNDVSVVNEL